MPDSNEMHAEAKAIFGGTEAGSLEREKEMRRQLDELMLFKNQKEKDPGPQRPARAEPDINLDALAFPFPAEDIEWRVGQCGKNDQGFWAKVLAYINARAVQDRLDEVCGPENWQDKYRYEGKAVLCSIGIRINGQWIWKEDGAEETDIEAVKGGISGAMKRAASKWGIGRYLYNLEEGWAEITETKKGANYAKTKEGQVFYWKAPPLPAWALPQGVDANANKGPAQGNTGAASPGGKQDGKASGQADKASPGNSQPGGPSEGYSAFIEKNVKEAKTLSDLAALWKNQNAGLAKLPKDEQKRLAALKDARKSELIK